jgi:hypothetical protein
VNPPPSADSAEGDAPRVAAKRAKRFAWLSVSWVCDQRGLAMPPRVPRAVVA